MLNVKESGILPKLRYVPKINNENMRDPFSYTHIHEFYTECHKNISLKHYCVILLNTILQWMYHFNLNQCYFHMRRFALNDSLLRLLVMIDN